MQVPWFSRWFGNRGERLAVRFLKQLGWSILGRQVVTRYGEVDIIGLDADTIVFVEVKTRSSVTHGRPEEAVDRAKQRRLLNSALCWLKRRRWLDRRIRFDIVSVIWLPGEPPSITHFPHAFEPEGRGQMFG